MTVEERVRPAAELKPEVASLNMGSMNFALFPMLNRYKEFKHDWERPYLEGTRDLVFRNTFQDIENILNDLRGRQHPLRVRVLRHRAPLQPGALPRPRPGQAAAVRADGVRHPRRHRHPPRGRDAHEAHRRPAVRRQVPLVGARRRPQSDADRRDGGRHGRQRARRPRGLAVDRPRQARRSRTPSRSRTRARSSRASASRSPRPTRRARSSRSRAATRSRSSQRLFAVIPRESRG